MHWTNLPKVVAVDAIESFCKDFHIRPGQLDEAEWEADDYIEPDCEPDPEINWEEMTYEVYKVTVGSRVFHFWVAITSDSRDAYYWREEKQKA